MPPIKITYNGGVEDPWQRTIENFLTHEFPHAQRTNESRLESVTAAFLASRQRRLGPNPAPEALAKIRTAIRYRMDRGEPIEVLVPFGPKKPVAREIPDVAELAALRALACLQAEVQEHYAPGMRFSVRMEDATGLILERGTVGLERDISAYLDIFEGMIRVLGYDKFIVAKRETQMAGFANFHEKVLELTPTFMAYFKEPSEEFKAQLAEMGWSGPLSQEQQAFLLSRYQKFNPERTHEDHQDMMATYLACALARKKLGMTGAAEGPGMSLSFAPPQPDDPIDNPRVYYRTVLMDHSKLHIPPWRAKGVIKIKEDKPRFAVINWSDTRELNKGTIVIDNGEEAVPLSADYEV